MFYVQICQGRGPPPLGPASQPQALSQGQLRYPSSFSPDGKRLAYRTDNQLWTVPVGAQRGQWTAGKPERFLESSFVDLNATFSPDGRWLAYSSNESGKVAVYVRPFPLPSSGQGGKWQVSNNGGTMARWSSCGEVVYREDDQLMAATYSVSGDTFVPEKPRVVIAKLGGRVLGFPADAEVHSAQ